MFSVVGYVQEEWNWSPTVLAIWHSSVGIAPPNRRRCGDFRWTGSLDYVEFDHILKASLAPPTDCQSTPSMNMTIPNAHIFPTPSCIGGKRHLHLCVNQDAVISLRAFLVVPYFNIEIKQQNYLPTFITERHNLISVFIQINTVLKTLMFMYPSPHGLWGSKP